MIQVQQSYHNCPGLHKHSALLSKRLGLMGMSLVWYTHRAWGLYQPQTSPSFNLPR
jgi:hypothetical protein